MGEKRPLSDGADPQSEQYELLRATGNGPTTDSETELLREQFGEPDDNGVYGAPGGESAA